MNFSLIKKLFLIFYVILSLGKTFGQTAQSNQLFKLKDYRQNFSIDSIIKIVKGNHNFNSSSSDLIVYPDTTYWFMLKIDNPNSEQLYLSSHFMLNHTICYFYDSNFVLIKTDTVGFSSPYHLRAVKSLNNVFQVPICKSTYCILKIKTQCATATALSLLSSNQLNNLNVFESNINSAFLGFFVLAIFYSLFFFIVKQQYEYLAYTLYVISFWGMIISISHQPVYYFSWLQIEYSNAFVYIPHYINMLSLLWYGSEILKLRTQNPKTFTVVKVFAGIILLQMILKITFKTIEIDNWLNIISTIPLFYTVYFRVYQSKQISYAYIILMIGIVINYLAHINLMLDLNQYIPFYLTYSTYGIMEVLIFGVLLAFHQKHLNEQKEYTLIQLVNQKTENEKIKTEQNFILEQKVKERTEQLNNAFVKLDEYSKQIAEMNQLLNKENTDLKENVRKQINARAKHSLMSFNEFKESYPTVATCLNHIESIKWEHGFKCSKCKNQEYTFIEKDHVRVGRKCTKCSYPESTTSKTLFHSLKFDLVKAFYITYVASSNKKISMETVAKEIDLRLATTYNFVNKVKIAISKTGKTSKNEDGWSHLIKYQVENQEE